MTVVAAVHLKPSYYTLWRQELRHFWKTSLK